MTLESQLRSHFESQSTAPIPPGRPVSALVADARRRHKRTWIVSAGIAVLSMIAVAAVGLLLTSDGAEEQRVEVVDDPPVVIGEEGDDEQSGPPDAQIPPSVRPIAAGVDVALDPDIGLPIAITATESGYAYVELATATEPARGHVSTDGQTWQALSPVAGTLAQATSLQLQYRDGRYLAVAEVDDQIVVGTSADLVSWTSEVVVEATATRLNVVDLVATEAALAFKIESMRPSTQELVVVLGRAERLPTDVLASICSYVTTAVADETIETIEFDVCLDPLDQDEPELSPDPTVLRIEAGDPLFDELAAMIGPSGAPTVSIWAGPIEGPYDLHYSGTSEAAIAATSSHLASLVAESGQLALSSDGRDWIPSGLPDRAGAATELTATGDVLVLLSPTFASYTEDLGQRWETVSVGTGQGETEWLDGPEISTGPAGIALQGASFDRQVFTRDVEPVSLDVDGVTVIVSPDDRMKIVRSGTVVADIDLNTATDDEIVFAEDGSASVNDPTTGQRLVLLPPETMSELRSRLLVEYRSVVVSADGKSWHQVILDGLDVSYVVPVAVGADDVLVFGLRQETGSPLGELYLVPVGG